VRIPKLNPRPRTNGHITNNVLAITLNTLLDEETIRRHVAYQLRQFPLSSSKLVYSDTLERIRKSRGEGIATAVVEVCIEHDKKGLAELNALHAEAGCEPVNTFGRYTEK
jgi:hypothetical protein